MLPSPTLYSPKELQGKKEEKKKNPISECMCNFWPGGRPGQAGNILEAKLPFQRNLSFFTSVPKLFKLPKELNI